MVNERGSVNDILANSPIDRENGYRQLGLSSGFGGNQFLFGAAQMDTRSFGIQENFYGGVPGSHVSFMGGPVGRPQQQEMHRGGIEVNPAEHIPQGSDVDCDMD